MDLMLSELMNQFLHIVDSSIQIQKIIFAVDVYNENNHFTYKTIDNFNFSIDRFIYISIDASNIPLIDSHNLFNVLLFHFILFVSFAPISTTHCYIYIKQIDSLLCNVILSSPFFFSFTFSLSCSCIMLLVLPHVLNVSVPYLFNWINIDFA